jgi:hypothetical protein
VSSGVALRHSASRSQTPSLFDGPGGEPTLDDVLAGVWEGLAARAAAPCPVCGARMEPVNGTDRARCTSCGSSLS